ncbi:PREDICTED: protein TRI1-like [Erythranthe guttata]|uniref:protein TRI1-like n=1 Tax=Erythranthe guttata TaxID=4155 RepID=UPI00064D9919|nr:PREDICTED: protein TRI1-like [Erythranthe guttata]|eukprot:XP_012836743.1 PREDICTED: protein TRI1-like [Erythranthe guttata]
MVSDSEIVGRLHEILRASDLETTTAACVRRRLEEEFSVNLYGRRVFIREQIDLFLRDAAAAQNDVVEQVEEVGENPQNDAVEKEQGQKENTGADENGEEEEASDEEDEDEVSKRKQSRVTDVKKKGGGFCKPCALSPQLEELFGVSQLPRTAVVKKLWEYIREHNLQNPKDRRKILCDDALHQIFRVKSVDMFKMNKALSKHIWPLDEVALQSNLRKGNGKANKTKKKMSQRRKVNNPKRGQYIKENDLQDPSDKRRVGLM